MKVKHEYKCANCGCSIEYGYNCASCYNGELYCCDDCALDAADIKAYDWCEEDEYEFDYPIDESNGYGVNRISDECYSNGEYAIFDKCPFEFDKDYKAYFGLKVGGDALENLAKNAAVGFDTAEFITVKKPWYREVKRRFPSSHAPNHYLEILGKWFDANLYFFIMKQLNSGIQMPDEVQIALHDLKGVDEVLFIICNGKRAILVPEPDTPAVIPSGFEPYQSELTGDNYV